MKLVSEPLVLSRALTPRFLLISLLLSQNSSTGSFLAGLSTPCRGPFALIPPPRSHSLPGSVMGVEVWTKESGCDFTGDLAVTGLPAGGDVRGWQQMAGGVAAGLHSTGEQGKDISGKNRDCCRTGESVERELGFSCDCSPLLSDENSFVEGLCLSI